jgi:pSer/pThr/pTyr-binding forkhead associated (FHA) protein
MDVPPTLPALPEQPSPPGELVGQNGVRRPLKRPLTLLGQSAACDVRLSGQAVAPLHCAIIPDPAGPLLRDLGSASGTRVNGQPVHAHRLANGDVIEVAGFEFAVELDTPPTHEGPSADAVLAEREQEALRVQAAAVCAQQAALTEEEARLEQRATALERQETQLAGHLEERQARLDEEHERLRREREEHEAAQAADREALGRERDDLAAGRAELAQERDRAARQRRRLAELRRRLWKRHQRHWQAREAALARLEAQLAAREGRLEREREAVRSFQERVNGELELGRRRLREEAEELALAQQRWHEGLEEERAGEQRRRAELERRAAEVEAAAGALAAEEQRWRQQHAQLSREAEGLEARIRHQRAQLDALLRESAQAQPQPAGPVIPEPLAPVLRPDRPAAGEWPARLRQLAGILGDQRAHLAEQWQRLLEVQQAWQEERTTALAELEAVAARLSAREQELARAEERTRTGRLELHHGQEDLAAARGALEGREARLASEQAGWQAQREQLLARVEERERLLEQRRRQLDEVQERRNRRRKEEVAQVQSARARCDEARRQSSQLWQECEGLRAALAERERRLLAEAQALERLRAELLQQAPDSARAEGRLERLGKREAARLEADSRHLQAEGDRLRRERERLDDDARRLGQLEEALLARQRDWSRQVGEWEQQCALAEEEERRRQEELRRLRAQRALDERQLRQLREEIERLARVLIEEAPEQTPAQKAA